jgi:hypothetical protein
VAAYNERMRSDDLARFLSEIAGAETSIDDDGVVVARVAAIGDAVRLDPATVLNAYEIVVPSGAPGIEFGIRRGREELPLIVTADDVVFMPADAADMIEPGMALRVPAGPDLVAYSEMRRDLRALGRVVDREAGGLDVETLAATVLMHRCFLSGAMRIGLWPVRVAAWWEYAWATCGDRLPLPPFRPDKQWDELMAGVAAARRATAAQPRPRPATDVRT